ncbi:MAG: DUF4097 domain-containing protein [Clostridiales bacterium]|nr:DUF4097 domain-containing protein [Clostridiales bacterium]
MKTIWKVVIILIAVGLVLSLAAVWMGASRWVYWDKRGPQIAQETRITELALDAFQSIDIDAEFADIEFIEADAYGIDIRYFDSDVTWSAEDGNLKINFRAQKRYHINLSFSNTNSYIKVYLPANAQLGKVSVQADSGDIKLGSFQAEDVRIQNSFGEMRIYSITCSALQINLNSGDFSGKNLTVAGELDYKIKFGASSFETVKAKSLRIDSNSGDLAVDGCIADMIDVKNNFGVSKYETVTAKTLAIDSNSGDISINACRLESLSINQKFGEITATNLVSSKTKIDANSADIRLSGDFSGRTDITNAFGSVKFTTSLAKEAYTYDLYTEFGDVTVDGSKGRNSVHGGNSTEHFLYITNTSGDIRVDFSK